jgi:hypothetical protein
MTARASKRPMVSLITRARKTDAGAIIAAAQRRLADVDPRALDSDVATGIAAAIRHVRSASFTSSPITAARRPEVQRLADLLDRIHRSIPDERRDAFERECRALDLDPTTNVSPLTRTLATLSDVLRATLAPPWDHDVFREFGIVCRPDGYPAVTPRLMPGEVLGALVDELAHVAIPTQTYTISDHFGEEYQVLGPASDADHDRVSIARLRAWRRVSVAQIQKEMEVLPPPAQRKLGSLYGQAWPFACALAGLAKPGTRGSGKSVDIRAYLQVERFGTAPHGTSEKDDEAVASTDPIDVPALPAFASRGFLATRSVALPVSGPARVRATKGRT